MARSGSWAFRLKVMALVAVPAVVLATLVPATSLGFAAFAITVVAAAAVPLAVFGAARGSAPLADVGVADGTLVVRPRGANQAWSLRRVLTVPVGDVADIGLARAADLPVGLRSPGTSVPGFRAGTYGTGDQRSFWLVRRASVVLVIELADRPIRRIVLEVDDPEATASRLRAAVTGGKR